MNRDEATKLLEEVQELYSKSQLLKEDMEFNLKQILNFIQKYNENLPCTEEGRNALFAEAKMHLGRIKISAQEQRKVDELYDKIRLKLNEYCGEEVMPQFPKEPYADEIIRDMFKNDPSKWWEGV